jgi:hypothetical protein
MGGLVARPCQVISARTGGHEFKSHRLHTFLQTNCPMNGFHVVAHDWATWNLTTFPQTSMFQAMTGPRKCLRVVWLYDLTTLVIQMCHM